MPIETLNNDQFTDLFPQTDNSSAGRNNVRFGQETMELTTDLLKSTTEQTTQASVTETTTASTTDQTTQSSTTDTTTASTDVNLLESEEDKKKGRRPKYNFDDAAGYFKDRIDSGKFIAIEEVKEDGTKTSFIPKTPEEFDEVIDIQVNYQLQQKQKQIEEKWYDSKSPAWKAVAKYADMIDDPTEIIPFLQGVRMIESVADINENDLDGAEKVVRTRLQQKGDSEDIIEETVDSLKKSDKLISTAQKYKPMIVNQEKQQLQQLTQQRQKEQQDYLELVSDIRDGAIKAIDSPIFGKTNLKKEEKSAVYELIAQPNEKTKGFPIYSAIDDLYEKGNFELLKKIALLLHKEESFLGYISTDAANKTAQGLHRTLQAANSGRGSANDPEVNENRPTVQRNQYNQPLRFGR